MKNINAYIHSHTPYYYLYIIQIMNNNQNIFTHFNFKKLLIFTDLLIY